MSGCVFQRHPALPWFLHIIVTEVGASLKKEYLTNSALIECWNNGSDLRGLGIYVETYNIILLR